MHSLTFPLQKLFTISEKHFLSSSYAYYVLRTIMLGASLVGLIHAIGLLSLGMVGSSLLTIALVGTSALGAYVTQTAATNKSFEDLSKMFEKQAIVMARSNLTLRHENEALSKNNQIFSTSLERLGTDISSLTSQREGLTQQMQELNQQMEELKAMHKLMQEHESRISRLLKTLEQATTSFITRCVGSDGKIGI